MQSFSEYLHTIGLNDAKAQNDHLPSFKLALDWNNSCTFLTPSNKSGVFSSNKRNC